MTMAMGIVMVMTIGVIMIMTVGIVMIMTMVLYVVLMIMMMIRVSVLPLNGCILPSGFRRDSNLIILQVWWFHFNAYTVSVDASIIHPGFACFSP